MALLAETAAVALAIRLAITLALPSDAPRLGLAVAIVATVLAGTTVWPSLSGVLTEARHDAATPQAQVDAGIAAATGANQPFIEWIRARMPTRATYLVVPPSGIRLAGPSPDLQWTTYELLPRRAVDRPQDAGFAVFARVPPRALPGFGRPVTFAPGFALAERRRAR